MTTADVVGLLIAVLSLQALVTRLPPVPAYYQRYFGGNDLIVIDTRTNRIVAIIRDVWR